MNFSRRHLLLEVRNNLKTLKHSGVFCKAESFSWVLPRYEFHCSGTHQESWNRRRGILGACITHWEPSSTWLLLHHGWCSDWSGDLLRSFQRETSKNVQALQESRVWSKAHCVLMVCMSILILPWIWSFLENIWSFCPERYQSYF